MALSIFVARCLSVVYVSAGIAAVSGKISFNRVIEDFERSPGLTYITGFITIIAGMSLVTYHNIWVKDWAVVITIIGWLALVKGFMFIAFPGLISSFKGMYKNAKAWGVLVIALGILFGYLGFIAA